MSSQIEFELYASAFSMFSYNILSLKFVNYKKYSCTYKQKFKIKFLA